MSLKFKHIKIHTCTKCGSKMRSATISGQHVNGEQFETMEFTCGYKIEYVPNFSTLVVETPCRNEPDEIKRKEQVEQALQSIKRIVSKYKLDSKSIRELEFKISIEGALRPKKDTRV